MIKGERFTEKALGAVNSAWYESSPRGLRPVRPEHILLGLLTVDPQLFRLLSLSPNDQVKSIRDALKAFIPRRRKNWTSTELPTLSPAAEQVIALAAFESEKLRHGYIGTEHLLLGLLLSEHESEPPRRFGLMRRRLLSVSRVLKERGFNVGEVTRKIDAGSVTPQTWQASGGPVLRASHSS